MNSLKGYLIVAGAIILAGIFDAYHPFQTPLPHYQLIINSGDLFLSDTTTGQVWVLNATKREWTRLQLPKPQ